MSYIEHRIDPTLALEIIFEHFKPMNTKQIQHLNILNIDRTFLNISFRAYAALPHPQTDPTLEHFDHAEHRTDPTLARDHF